MLTWIVEQSDVAGKVLKLLFNDGGMTFIIFFLFIISFYILISWATSYGVILWALIWH